MEDFNIELAGVPMHVRCEFARNRVLLKAMDLLKRLLKSADLYTLGCNRDPEAT